MLPPRYRLTRSSDFGRVRARGRSWPARMAVIIAAPNGLGYSRFGFSVSKRIGNAVVRNRTRRLMREAVRLQLDVIAPGWDVVFVARRGIVGQGYWAVEESVVHLLACAGLYTASGALPGRSDESS